MNKLLLCFALLAMSYIASAEVDTYTLPLNVFITRNTAASSVLLLNTTCSTSDGVLHYLDIGHNDTTGDYVLLRSWNASSNETTDGVDITNATLLFVAQRNAGGFNASALQCIGNDVYLSLAQSVDQTTPDGTHLYLFTLNDTANVTTYVLPLSNYDLAKSQVSYEAGTAATSNGLFYYTDKSADGHLFLQVWNTSNQSLADAINITNTLAQAVDIVAGLDELSSSVSTLLAIGETLYYNIAYDDEAGPGVQLIQVLSSANGSVYSLDVTDSVQNNVTVDYLERICVTTDGVLHYLDSKNLSSNVATLRAWEDDSHDSADSIDYEDLLDQKLDFIASLGNTTVTLNNPVLRCVGTGVYLSVEFTNVTVTGIELFELIPPAPKSAGLLSFSYVALLLASIALLF